MQSDKSQIVTKRFFELINELVELGHIHFKHDLYNELGVNNRNMYQLSRNYSKDILQLEWLTYMVEKYHVSAKYLLTGNGPHFTKKLEKIERPLRRKYNKTKKTEIQPAQ